MTSRSFAGFIGRTIAYTLVIGVTSAIAQYVWGQLNLDQNDALVACAAAGGRRSSRPRR